MSRRHPACREIEPDLPVVAAGEAGAAAAERVEQHVERCPPCREELGRYRAVEGLLGDLRGLPLPGDDPTLARAELDARLADLRRRVVAVGVFGSPLGPVLIARSEEGVAMVSYLDRQEGPLPERVRRALGDEVVVDPGAAAALHRDLLEYLEGRRTHLDWPLDLRAVRSDFQRRVLEATARLPYGAVTSYAGIARQIGAPRSVRPVAQALRHNPVPIAVPCHRVIGNGGTLVGYAGRRVELKQRLLAVEGVRTLATDDDYRVSRQGMYVRYHEDREYCLPTCGSLGDKSLAELTLFGVRAHAETAGLQPCSTCRPDLHPLSR